MAKCNIVAFISVRIPTCNTRAGTDILFEVLVYTVHCHDRGEGGLLRFAHFGCMQQPGGESIYSSDIVIVSVKSGLRAGTNFCGTYTVLPLSQDLVT